MSTVSLISVVYFEVSEVHMDSNGLNYGKMTALMQLLEKV